MRENENEASVGGEDLEGMLTQRGVNAGLAAWIVFWLEHAAIRRTLAWYDRQRGRVGPGVLVNELRRGGAAPERTRTTTLDEQRAYADSIVTWLRANLPDCCDEQGRPHYKAVVAVIHLHHRHGKGSLTVRAHGAVIRAAVRAARRSEEEGGGRDG